MTGGTASFRRGPFFAGLPAKVRLVLILNLAA